MKYILLYAAFLFPVAFVYGQECRPANDKEQQALTKLVTAMDDNLSAKLVDDDWELKMKTDNTMFVANVPYARPLMFCGNAYRADFTLKESSTLYSQLNDSAAYYFEQSSKTADGKQALKLMQKNVTLISQETYGIAVVENSPAYYLQDPGSGQVIDHYTKLSVPGAALALQIWYKGVTKDDELTQQTVLCFGNWKNDLVKAADIRWYFPYAFRHEKNTPFIENIVIVIHADATRASDIIKRIDWTKMNDALTP